LLADALKNEHVRELTNYKVVNQTLQNETEGFDPVAKGFAYDLDYTATAIRQDAANYLSGENRAFVDQMSMSFPQEDRSRMLYYAMGEGNEDFFTSQIMQAKLLRLCEGIREGYGLEKKSETYFWEQYLNQSLAYQK